MAHVLGTNNNDYINGPDEVNAESLLFEDFVAGGIYGLGGDDSLNGNSEIDFISGGEGNDTIHGSYGNDYYERFAAQHVGYYYIAGGLYGDIGDDVIDGGGGRDKILGGLGADLIYGGDGDDADDFYASYRPDASYVASGLFGGDGNDTIAGGRGTDLLQGGAGDDVLYGGENNDQSGGTINGLTPVAGLYGEEGNDRLWGQAGDDYLDGGIGDDILVGGDGSDNLLGGDGNDRLDGGIGSDRQSGGLGNDIYFVDTTGDAVIEASDGGLDTVYVADGWGNGGDVPANYVLAAAVEILNILGTTAIDGNGNGGNNIINGNAGANRIVGLSGDDLLRGWDGDDELNGGSGNDTLTGGMGNDILDGATGPDVSLGGHGDDLHYLDSSGDRVIEFTSEGRDTVVLRESYDDPSYRLPLNVEDLTLLGTTARTSVGNADANLITGSDGNDRIWGANENDTLSGAGGDDELRGMLGNDVLGGGIGQDRLLGGLGKDQLMGGTGVDQFTYGSAIESPYGAGRDIIVDWSIGDLIDLLVIDADANQAGNQAFDFIGLGTATSGVGAGEAKYFHYAGKTYVSAGTDADAEPELQIELVGLHSLSATDFML
jgi:Ca2+-binding RTX toxin-like protein